MGSWAKRTHGKAAAGEQGQVRWQLVEWVAGERDRLSNPGFQHQEIKPQNL